MLYSMRLYLAPTQVVTRWNFAKLYDTHKSRMIGLPCGEESMTTRYEYRNATGRWTDRQTDRIAISITRDSMVTCDKNQVL